MGENQYLKLLQRKRSQYFGMIRPTLVNPDIVLEELSPSENGERDTVLLFIKTFIKPDGSRYVHFESVTIQKDSMEISISSHEIQEEDLKKKMRNDNVAHLRDSLSASEWRLNGRPSDGSDLVPTPSDNLSDSKDSENLETPSDSARFSVITPEMDAEYLAAVERGDMATAQRLVLEAAKFAMPNTKVVDENGNPKVVYHGTGYKGNVFTSGFFASDEQFATDYGFAGNGFNTRVVNAFINMTNPRVVDADYANYDEIKVSGQTLSADDLVRETKKGGVHDGLIIKNVDERSTGGFNWTDDYIPFSPSQIKSADPVTYDDNGNVIPLSQRFNPENSDIRFSVLDTTKAELKDKPIKLNGMHRFKVKSAFKGVKGADGSFPYLKAEIIEVSDGYNGPAFTFEGTLEGFAVIYVPKGTISEGQKDNEFFIDPKAIESQLWDILKSAENYYEFKYAQGPYAHGGNWLNAEGNVFFSVGRGSLVGMHNISEEKLRKLIKQGGSANPSIAVIDIERQSFDSYGDISLIMPSSLVDAETGRNAGTFTADAWTPTYPQIEKRFSVDELQRAYWRDITAIPEEMQHEVRMAFDSWLNNRTASGLAYMFLQERGEAPEMVRVAARFPQEIKDKMSAILGEGRTGFYELTDEEKQAVLDLYIQENFGGSREDFDSSIDETIQRIEDRLSTGKVPSFIEKRITADLQWMKEHGYNYDNISDFVRNIVSDIRHAGEVNAAATTNRALDYIKDNNLSAEYEQWKESLNDRYGIKEYLFDGFTPSGNPRWLPNTVENASKLMNKQGLAGATGMVTSFNRFVATLAPKKKSLSDIRSSKDLLVEDEKLMDDFRDKWSEVFFDLGIKCQPDAKGYEDYGLERLTEAAQKKNPGAYLKKEYGVELSQEDLQRLADMIKAIKTEFPARYFETKFQRPVYLNEFAAAVIPITTSADIKQAIVEAGLPIFEYDSSADGARREATLKATDIEGVRFSFIGERGAAALDKADEATVRLDNLAVAREMESAGKDAKAIKLATGWERGVDKKWRYEISDKDFSLKEGWKEAKTLGDAIEHEELFAAHPELKGIIISFEPNEEYEYLGYRGVYDNGRIWVNPTGDFTPTLMHEIQHAIQELEGFAQGGNENIEDPKRVKQKENDSSFFINRIAQNSSKIEDLRKRKAVLHEKMAAWFDSHDENAELDDEFNKYNDEYSRVEEEIEKVSAQIASDGRWLERVESTPTTIGYEGYRKVAGEVEARNTAARLAMSYNERLNSLAQETEDVVREDQIILEDALREAVSAIRFSVFEPHNATIDEIDGLFREYNMDESLAPLYDKVSALAHTMDLKIRFDYPWSAAAGSTFGDKVKFNTEFFNSLAYKSQDKAHALLHEMIHATTNYAIAARNTGALTEGMKEAVSQLEGIYGEILNDSAFDGTYGARSVYEMVAELSNPEFRSLLKEKNLFQRIVDAIKRLLGIEVGENALDNLSATLDYMLDNYDGRVFGAVVNQYQKHQEYTRFSVANENQAIFVSNAARAVEGIKMEKATPAQWLAMIEKNGGLKAGEDKWMGLSDWLKASDKKTLTKQEVLDFIGEHMIRIEEQHYSEGEDSEYEKKREVEEALQSIFDEYVVESEEENDDIFMATHYHYAIEKLIAELGYSGWGAPFVNHNGTVELDIEEEDYDTLNELCDKLGIERFNGTRSIDDTRIQYTTSGLTNKHEIALTVPTIESWEERDYVHFGDAGEGRAVAWIRFGETKAYATTKEGEEYKAFVDNMLRRYHIDEDVKLSRFGTIVVPQELLDALTDEQMSELQRLKVASMEASDKTEQRILVIDEIQSNRHQAAREEKPGGKVDESGKTEKKGYRDDAKIAQMKEQIKALEAEQEQIAKDILHKQGYIFHDEEGGKFSEKEEYDALNGRIGSQEQMARQKAISEELYNLNHSIREMRKGIPAAPFENNWHELAMKRMLRYAAENGYDYIAWTKGEQQAERYNIGNIVEYIDVAPYEAENSSEVNGFDVSIATGGVSTLDLYVTESGEITSGQYGPEDLVGKQLSDVVGKDLAAKILSTDRNEISVRYEGDDFRIGGEGMKGFYDKMLPAFMNKYGKKWGVKVKDIELPNLEEAGRIMHSVPVTDAMKESVMEGQVMFSAVSITPEVRQEMDTIKAKAMWNGTFMKAPNGTETKLTEDQWLMVRTKNFINWFGDWINDPESASKVVDPETREPRVMYHGSAWHPLTEPKGNAVFRMRSGLLGKGAYFASSIEEATMYAEMATDIDMAIEGNYEILQDEYVTDYFLNIRNTEDIRDFGRGDIIAVAKSPSQIKSATDTTGEFSESGDIRYSSRFDVDPNPTEAQKKAGNYKMGHLRLDGYNITIENPKGSVRRGTDADGNEWENVLNNDYGYIRGTKGVDGDHIDVYLSDNPAEGNVFVIDQVNPKTREFDEHKVMYGFNSMDEAREAYLANFSEGWNGLGTITEVTKDEFRKWIDSSHRKTKPFSEYKSVKAEGAQSEGREESEVSYSFLSTPTDQVVSEGMRLSIQDFAKLAGNIFEALPEAARKEAIEETFKRGWDMQSAIFQIPARLAEKESWNESDKELAQIIRDKVQDAMEESGVVMSRPLTTKEALWMLYRSTEANGDSMMDAAKRAMVAYNLGFDKETLALEDEAREAVRFSAMRDATVNAKASMYNRGAVNVMTRLKETFVDMNASVEELVSAIEERSGKKAKGFENILMALNQQSSKGLAAMESYEMQFLNPMFDEIRKIMNETDFAYEDIVRYVILKHGLERNEKLAQRDARSYYQEIYDDIIDKIRSMSAAQKRTYLTNAQLRDADAKAELARLQSVDTSAMSADEKREHKMTVKKAQTAVNEAAEHLERAQKIASMSEKEAEDELQMHFDAIAAQTDNKYNELRKNDYSGITSMFYDQFGVNRSDYATEEEYQAALMNAKKHKYDTLGDVEGAADMEVKLFEGAVDTKGLWKRINAATKETLRQQYEANMISKEQYDNLRGMFEYYVPLRGFKDNTAEDMYTYYRRPNSTGYTKPILAAEGRKTEAESPFGWIASMAGSAIASNVKNEAKLALYYFVSNRPENGIATVSKTWYVHTPGDVDDNGKRIFRPAYPTFSEDLSTEEAKDRLEQWQEQMRELKKQGLAYESGQKLNLGNAVVNISEANKPEHIVNVKVAGKDYTIIINGNPRAAQAINGDLNIEATAQDYNAVFGPILRWMSSVNTSYNPEFWITNMMRDMAFTWMAVNTKESPEYRRKFGENYRKAFSVIRMVAKNEKGTLGDSYLEKMYKEFVEYGGVTGYTQIKDNETWEKEIEKYLSSNDPKSIRSGKVMKGVKTVSHAFHRFGESLEQVSRFAAFLTSREMGKPMAEAVNDAKEITVNFNRKGSGKMISLEEAKHLTGRNGKPLSKFWQWVAVAASSISPLGRRFIMFFNAAIQGLNATYKLYKANPKRMIGWTLAYASLGMMNAVLHAFMDDDDDYLDMPQYERRNSLMIGGGGVYLKWALPQEARAFYALGDIAVESIMGRNPHQNVAGEIGKVFAELLPINPAEGWKAFLPSIAVPAFELLLNEDYKGDPIYNEMKWLTKEERERTAKWSNAKKGTGKTWVLISQGLNNVTGGDMYDAGLINIQPEKMEHLVQSAFGGTIRTADKFITTVIAMIDPEEEWTAKQTPFLNRVLTINDERFRNVHVNDVFDFYKAEAEHAISLEKKYIKAKDSKALRELRSRDEYKWAKIYTRHRKALENINDKVREAEGTRERRELMKRQDELKKKMIKEFSSAR